MFTTTPDSAIDETEPSPFPAGCVFISSGASVIYRRVRSALRYLRALRTIRALTHAPRGAVADKLYDVTVNRACPGRLVSFSAPLPAGAPLRRVRSRGGLSRVTSGGDLRLIKTYAAGTLRNTPSFADLYGSAGNLEAIADEV